MSEIPSHGQLHAGRLQQRIDAALLLHFPDRVCAEHGQHHDCPVPSGYLYRCATCARTRRTPCKTWQALTGKEIPE